MVGNYLADILEHAALCSSDNVHHVLLVAPLLRCAQHLLEQTLTVLVFCELEVVTSLVAGESEQDNPLVLVAEERHDAVFAHVRSYSERVYVVLVEECASVHCACVADVAALCVSHDEVVGVVLLQILDCLLERDETLHAECLIESEVWLVGYTVRCCCINDSLVELEDHTCLCTLDFFTFGDTCWQFIDISIKTYAKETFLGEDLLY